jgi:diadenosine tetraphosphate (Ap4A) HIT family hydrolase
MANETMRKFGYPASLIREYQHWAVLLRPAQVTLGSLVLAAKSDVTAFGALPAEAFAELAAATAEIEATLKVEIGFERINYLMLMMVDPHVHFHVFPRYEGSRAIGDLVIEDRGWPGPPDLKSAVPLPQQEAGLLHSKLMQNWLITY